MKMFATVPVKWDPSRAIRQPRQVQCRIASRRYLLSRFRRFIESTDWERRYLCSDGIDGVCVGVLVAFLLYFVPALASFFLG